MNYKLRVALAAFLMSSAAYAAAQTGESSQNVPPPINGTERDPCEQDKRDPGACRVTVLVVPTYPVAPTDPVCDVYVDYASVVAAKKRVRWVAQAVLAGDKTDYRFKIDGIYPLLADATNANANPDNAESGHQDVGDNSETAKAFVVNLKYKSLGAGDPHRRMQYEIRVVAYDKKTDTEKPCIARDPLIVNKSPLVVPKSH